MGSYTALLDKIMKDRVESSKLKELEREGKLGDLLEKARQLTEAELSPKNKQPS
jgi:hypothetical protein